MAYVVGATDVSCATVRYALLGSSPQLRGVSAVSLSDTKLAGACHPCRGTCHRILLDGVASARRQK